MAKTPLAALAGVPDYEQHPLAASLMPGGMSTEEFDAFAEDVAARGIIYPITIFEGKVLDGWHRYRAAVRTGSALKTQEYSGTDPAGYIAACNVLRRKLSSLQRALVGAKLHLEHAVTQRDVCRRLGISNTVLSMVLKVIDSRNAKIIKRIETDSDYTRGMLREDLEDAGLVHSNYGRKTDEVDADEDDMEFTERAAGPGKAVANSVFDMARATGADELDEDLIGDDAPLPTVGKKASHPERRTKDTPAQRMQEHFRELMYDEKATFIQMVWADMRPIAEELGLPGLINTDVTSKAISKASKARAKA
jgi:ParB-like chromosome segregation protein Spo0J